jgi:hypothetical protein
MVVKLKSDLDIQQTSLEHLQKYLFKCCLLVTTEAAFLVMCDPSMNEL